MGTLFGLLARFLAWIAGADQELLSTCPRDDVRSIRMLALIMLLVWVFQTGMWSVAAHVVLAAPGEIRPAFIAFSALIATIVLLLDSYLVLRSGWYLHGLHEIRRGGIDISGGWLVRFKHSLFLAVRMGIGASFAQLTALMMSFIFFNADIRSEIERAFRHQNQALFAEATTRVDREIGGAVAALDESDRTIAALSSEIADSRRSAIDPGQSDPRLRRAILRVDQADEAKHAADQLVIEAEQFATDELQGIRRVPGNSGVPGLGPVRAAAEERVMLARRRATAAADELQQARRELQTAEATVQQTAAQKQAQSQMRVSALEGELAQERQRQQRASSSYRMLVDNREATIRDVVLRDPRHVPKAEGFLASVQALSRLAQDPVSFGVILLFEAAGFVVECAALFGKVFSNAPTFYERRLASMHYLDAVDHAEAVDHRLRRRVEPAGPPPSSEASILVVPGAPSLDIAPGIGGPQKGPDAAAAPRRGRGRPRKNAPQAPGASSQPESQRQTERDKTDERQQQIEPLPA